MAALQRGWTTLQRAKGTMANGGAALLAPTRLRRDRQAQYGCYRTAVAARSRKPRQAWPAAAAREALFSRSTLGDGFKTERKLPRRNVRGWIRQDGAGAYPPDRRAFRRQAHVLERPARGCCRWPTRWRAPGCCLRRVAKSESDPTIRLQDGSEVVLTRQLAALLESNRNQDDRRARAAAHVAPTATGHTYAALYEGILQRGCRGQGVTTPRR